MAHYAFLDENNVVIEVIVGKNEGEGDIDWEEHYSQVRGRPCRRTSYNTYAGQHKNGGIAFRKNYAGIGYTYDASLDAFIPPKPGDEYELDVETCLWRPK